MVPTALRGTGIEHFQTWSRDDTLVRISEGQLLVNSGFWSYAMLELAANARFIRAHRAPGVVS